jgi:protein-S-isoprenylcysteine O-methyltransferase Ste14
MTFYDALLYGFIVIALCTMPYLFRISAPYGRHSRGGFGPRINGTVGWLMMEAPASLVPLLLFWLAADRRQDPVLLTFLLLWQLHYLHRAFIFPFRRRSNAAMPILIPLSGILFNLGNTYLNWHYLTVLHPPYPTSWFTDPRFVVGTAVFLVGWAINQHSDYILLNLRRPGETGYKIPRGGLYGLVSCPNYLGELIEWTGWAILTWSLPGAVFALWTAANLVPRAVSHHKDYLRRFPDYPRERRAILPLVL